MEVIGGGNGGLSGGEGEEEEGSKKRDNISNEKKNASPDFNFRHYHIGSGFWEP